MSFSIVILAAGKGTRMASNKPKTLQVLAGKPMLINILEQATIIGADQVIIVHSPEDTGEIKKATKHIDNLILVEQPGPLGTGHALKQAQSATKQDNNILVLLGDVPLVKSNTLLNLIEGLVDCDIRVLSSNTTNPTGYGRVKRDTNKCVKAIIEEQEANEKERQINEVSSGIIAFSSKHLNGLLAGLDATNTKGEYYLTDTIENAYNKGLTIKATVTKRNEVFGVNDKKDLAHAEKLKREGLTNSLMEQGVTICDPKRVDIRGMLKCGKDVVIDVNTVFEGEVELLDGVQIAPFVLISNTTIGENTRILSHSNIDGANIGESCTIGPFARLRPGTELKNQAKIGNFVETKNTTIGNESKANHLTYVGDAEIGERTNIGAGTITCNYDGADKHKTIIGNNVFIGSGVELVAPITIESGATIGAGSTISKTAPANKLTVERAKQKTIGGWQRPTKNKGK
jgi:bifunctional UDP-N-acetylglucosamine pyrophosphorylase/glucosamine-1-phosphate N-acetyltransferase